MNYQQIHAALTESAESGEVCRIMRSFFDYNLVLTAKTEQYAWDWLGYSPIDADLKEDGQLPTFYEITHAAVNGYCREFINTSYSGPLPEGYTAEQYLSQFEELASYPSADELRASGDIYSSLVNDLYGKAAIESIYFERWRK